MVVLSLLPVGIIQAYTSITKGYSFARDPEKLSEKSVLPHPLDQLNVPRKEAVSLRFFDS